MSRIQSYFALIGRKQGHYGAGVFGSLQQAKQKEACPVESPDKYPRVRIEVPQDFTLRAELPKCVCRQASWGTLFKFRPHHRPIKSQSPVGVCILKLPRWFRVPIMSFGTTTQEGELAVTVPPYG